MTAHETREATRRAAGLIASDAMDAESIAQTVRYMAADIALALSSPDAALLPREIVDGVRGGLEFAYDAMKDAREILRDTQRDLREARERQLKERSRINVQS